MVDAKKPYLNFVVRVVEGIKFAFKLHGCFAASFCQGNKLVILGRV